MTNFEEQLQLSYVRAIAAAAGCIASSPDFDDGLDITLTHEADAHHVLGDRKARLEIQLKARRVKTMPLVGAISAQMSQKRYNTYRTVDPTINMIVVIMALPHDWEKWVAADTSALEVRYCSYWVNLAGHPANSAERPSVSAPLANIFDDVALCDMMERIGRGGKP